MITPIRTSRFLLAPVSSRYVLETSVSRVDILARQLGFPEHTFILVLQQNYAGNHTVTGWPANVFFINEQSGPDLTPGSQTVYQFFTQDTGKTWVVEVNNTSYTAIQATDITIDTSELTNVSGNTLPEVVASIDSQLGSSPEQVVYKLGNGAITLQVPDNTIQNGGNRGTGAIDLQQIRSDPTQVAQGNYSIVVGTNSRTIGEGANVSIGNNSNSGTAWAGPSIAIGTDTFATNSGISVGSQVSSNYSITIGIGSQSQNGIAIGKNCQATYGVAIGLENQVQNDGSWIPGGKYAVCGVLYGEHAWTSAKRVRNGDNQHVGCVLQASTLDNNPWVLTTDRDYPYYNWGESFISNVFMLNNNSMYTGYVKVGVQEETPTINADGSPGTMYRRAASWMFDITAVRGPSAANILLVNSSVLNSTRFFMPETVVAQIAVNTSNGSIEVRVTGLAGTTLHWIAEFMGVSTTA